MNTTNNNEYDADEDEDEDEDENGNDIDNETSAEVAAPLTLTPATIIIETTSSEWWRQQHAIWIESDKT